MHSFTFKDRIENLGYKSYEHYLASPYWKTFREVVLAREPRCRVCGVEATQVHHRVYDRLGEERFQDVVALCADCHEKVHTVHREQGILLYDFRKAASFIKCCRVVVLPAPTEKRSEVVEGMKYGKPKGGYLARNIEKLMNAPSKLENKRKTAMQRYLSVQGKKEKRLRKKKRA